MNERRDPPRLKDEPHAEWPAGFREVLAGYASSGPSAEVCGKVVEHVEARIGSHAAAGGSWKLPWRTGGIIVAVGIAGWFAYGRVNLELQPRVDSPPSALPHVSVEATPPVIEDVAEPASASATADADAVEPAPSATRESIPSLHAVPRRRIASKAHEHAPAETSAQTAAPVPAAAADPRAELALLIRARSILSSAPAQALALAEEHAARFPHSTFEEEREVLAIDAERRLGRVQSAAERARQFLKAHPSSIHRSSVESSARGR